MLHKLGLSTLLLRINQLGQLLDLQFPNFIQFLPVTPFLVEWPSGSHPLTNQSGHEVIPETMKHKEARKQKWVVVAHMTMHSKNKVKSHISLGKSSDCWNSQVDVGPPSLCRPIFPHLVLRVEPDPAALGDHESSFNDDTRHGWEGRQKAA